jgi:hypothetical protein
LGFEDALRACGAGVASIVAQGSGVDQRDYPSANKLPKNKKARRMAGLSFKEQR